MTERRAGSPQPAILLPRRRPGHLGPIHIVQLLLVEVVVVAVLATLTRGVIAVAGAALGGVIVLGLALGRRQGRWWVERRMMTRGYRRRRQSTAATSFAGDARLGTLRRFAPGLVVQNVAVADGAQVGVARDDAGWYAVAAVTPRAPMRDDPGALPLDVLADALAEAEQPGAVLQVVVQTVPAPSIDTHVSSPAGYSYRQLIARFGTIPTPADQAVWIAVRLDARSLAEAVPDDLPNLETAPAVVAALVRRMAKALRRLGISNTLLDADALLDALIRACDLERPPQQTDPVQPREEWHEWRSARLTHRSYWVRGWPPIGQAGAWLDWLSAAPSAVTTVSLILAPEDGGDTVDLRTLVRVAAPGSELAQVCQTLGKAAEEAKADLFPLDGEQAPAVYATAPTGGGAR